MKGLLVALMVLDVYVVVYYRLLVRFYYQKVTQRRETALGALFSFPPYRVLPRQGRRCVQRYWISLLVLIAFVLVLAWNINLPLAKDP
ncbi:MAG: hypothetical protein P8090_00010 [Gammaproteobacteria bacterium]